MWQACEVLAQSLQQVFRRFERCGQGRVGILLERLTGPPVHFRNSTRAGYEALVLSVFVRKLYEVVAAVLKFELNWRKRNASFLDDFLDLFLDRVVPDDHTGRLINGK